MINADRFGHWGDDIKPVSDDIVRLIFQNVNGLTQSSMVHAEIQKNGIQIQGYVRQTSIGTMFPFAIHGKEKNK